MSEVFAFTKDKKILKLCYKPIIYYLKLWEMAEDGLIFSRDGGWSWCDNLDNIDAKIKALLMRE